MEDNLPPGFTPGYTLSGSTSHSRAYDLLVKKAADLVRQEDVQRASPPRLSATTTTAKCRTRKLRDATSFLRKGDAPSTPRRTRRATKTSAFPRRTPRAKTDKAENGTNLPASNDVPPQYEATQQTAAAIFSPQTSSATAIEGAPAIPPFPKNGKECNQGETELEENLSSLPRQQSYRNTSHEFPSPSSCSQVTPAFSPPAVSTAESSPTGSPPAPSAATASPPEQAREAAATANSPGALFPPAPNPDITASAKKGSKQLTQQAAQASGEAPPKRSQPLTRPSCVLGTLTTETEAAAFPLLPPTGAPPGTPLCAPLVSAPQSALAIPKTKASAQNAAAPRRPAPRANASGPVETVLYRPRNRRTNFRSSTQEAISSFLATVDGVVRVRVNFRRNVVAADTPTGSPLDPLLSISDICGIAVRARQAANNTCSGIIFGVDTALGEEEIRENISSNLPVTSCSRSGHNIIVRFEGSKPPTEVALYKQRRTVKPRRPRPVECGRCLRYGHVEAACTFDQRCLRCGGAHEPAECTAATPKCIFCGDKHPATRTMLPSLAEGAPTGRSPHPSQERAGTP
ncbi:uncharacterized protein LOC119406663 [Rhipicephalus sanguineus]|uniref:uncharacterized protein LOC119406663 n=1 Tax=Rhipicephalus sanguineus TaxID=34632 RepID=UPI00189542A7|nr:uncharacterized protein LOC119406663 [Rhipicephalus sanguineus]